MMPCREESYRCEGFRFFRRCAGWPVDRDRERPVHAIHLEVAEPAAVSLLPAGTHSERSGVRADELVLELPPALLEKSLGERRGALELQRQEDIHDPRIQHLMYALLEDLREGCPAGSQYALSLVTALCVHLARRYTVRRAQPSSPVMPRTRLNRVLAFIEERVDENLRLADLAKAAGMSMFHFAKLFKQSTGHSPHQYVLARRMEKAKQLLRQEGVSVLEVSARTGFVDQRHFTKVFRRFTGFTPTAYRAAV